MKQILEKRRKRTIFKRTIKPSTVLTSGKGFVPGSKRRGVVYEIPCGECERKYIGQTKPENSIERIQRTFCQKIFLKTHKNGFNETCSPKWPWIRLGLRPRFTSSTISVFFRILVYQF